MIALPPDIEQRVRQIKAKLSTLSDAPTSMAADRRAAPTEKAKAEMLPGKTWRDHDRRPHLHAESREPPAVFDSVAEWFDRRLEKAKSVVEVRMLCAEAELRYNRARGTGPRPVATNTREFQRDLHSKFDERRKRCARNYEGLSPEEVELIESEHELGYCPAASVRKDRFQDGRDPETGLELPGERKLRGAERKLRARELWADGDGLSMQEIANRFGVAKSTVADWLGRRYRKDRAA